MIMQMLFFITMTLVCNTQQLAQAKEKKGFFTTLKEAYNLYFHAANDVSWQSELWGEKEKEHVLFGYQLRLEYIQMKDSARSAHTTLYFHGWGDTKNSARLIKKYRSIIKENLVTFNFSDARPILGKLGQSSFGQLPDVFPALYALNYTIDTLGLESIDLFGVSRGCAVIVNLLALLNDNHLFAAHTKQLTAIGIGHKERQKLLAAIQRGTIILDTPLRSMALTPFPQWIAQTFTRYDNRLWQPENTVTLLKGLQVTTIVHFQHRDFIVSNKQEADFFYALAQLNPQTTYLVMGNDGGHAHSHRALDKAMITFHALQKRNDRTLYAVINNKAQRIKNGELTLFAPHCQLTDVQHVCEAYHAVQ
ncbi:MAG: hypothetical protein WCE21_03065 [Candidatus Babeliales bacterium]